MVSRGRSRNEFENDLHRLAYDHSVDREHSPPTLSRWTEEEVAASMEHVASEIRAGRLKIPKSSD